MTNKELDNFVRKNYLKANTEYLLEQARKAVTPHAHWITTCDTLKKCSNCGYDFMPTNSQHYCPCCGALMQEDEDGAEID